MLSEFKLQSEIKNNSLVITTSGYINNKGGESILNEYQNNDGNSIKKVVLDLQESKVVNSIGISFLIELIEKLNSKEAKLIFTNLDPSVEKTFNIMGLMQFAQLAESVDKAIE